MNMFKEYGFTKEEINNVLKEFNIVNVSIKEMRNNLAEIISMIDNDEIETDYNADDLFNIVAILEDIENNGLTLDDFVK